MLRLLPTPSCQPSRRRSRCRGKLKGGPMDSTNTIKSATVCCGVRGIVTTSALGGGASSNHEKRYAKTRQSWSSCSGGHRIARRLALLIFVLYGHVSVQHEAASDTVLSSRNRIIGVEGRARMDKAQTWRV
uniref:Uncharacterized protein n=1 Tax=Craspedostauros australis TaxID=1486917 RepID=A0A6T6FUS5_9STRA|mmetsp:Transcript_18358/g.50953  ORF Transcript_18358/g.50953 Transcript_18358/m.50953 type:complete len:131 (+) Transcript_18358:172-564(+)